MRIRRILVMDTGNIYPFPPRLSCTLCRVIGSAGAGKLPQARSYYFISACSRINQRREVFRFTTREGRRRNN